MPAPKQARSELSTSRLLDAAADLIAEGGYERMTLSAIAKRAGYTHGLVTSRFGSKEGLLWALVERMVVDWGHTLLLPTVADQAGAAAIHTTIAALRDSWRRAPSRMRSLYILMFEALMPIPLLHQRMAELHRELRCGVQDAVERGISDGSVSSRIDSAGVARLVVGALRGAVYQAMLDPDEVSMDDALADVEAMVDAILPGPSHSTPDR
ncbi:TetR/AcrR family transcriptional regulator [Streptomyces sp. BV129]|uniref:TetR/AcrR family transcriptional regulator n=1 Tax=Streptomyces sp. BV129 TaxID=2849671 RepID=UPI001C2E86BB|nr:TetR/AcrR family transcriptional regulator [Streptomyces sp. BV129]MBV1949049.1 TetR/AcrR family transcriptional regulator [Streptomyces sp. BV129]